MIEMIHQRWRLESRDSVDSTMPLALDLWRDDPADRSPLLVVAAEQVAGMGRSNRAWVSPRGGLWMTLAWGVPGRMPDLGSLPLAAGLAVAEAVERLTSLDIELKWPNDLLVGGRKLCGILCRGESGGPRPLITVGVGLNANFPASMLGEGLRTPPTSLLDELGEAVPLGDLRDAIADSLIHRLDEVSTYGFPSLIDAVARRLAWRGRTVECRLPPDDRVLRGVVEEVDLHGRLLLRQENGAIIPLHQGELFAPVDP
jgi:BirA family biotin operon repressor/biotin-[acetyl-CoA-carboxylase] ligase